MKSFLIFVRSTIEIFLEMGTNRKSRKKHFRTIVWKVFDGFDAERVRSNALSAVKWHDPSSALGWCIHFNEIVYGDKTVFVQTVATRGLHPLYKMWVCRKRFIDALESRKLYC